MHIRDVRWLIHVPVEDTCQLVLFSACDAEYLKYAISLIRSVDLFSPGSSFTLHLINPDESSLLRIKRFEKTLKNTILSISSETIDLSAIDDNQKKSYYASARFSRLSTLLKEIKCPIFSLDADSLVVSPIDMNFSDKADADVVLVRRDQVDNVSSHLAILTGSIWFRPATVVCDFLDQVGNDVDTKLMTGTINWFDDQIIFYEKMQKFKKFIKYYNLKTKYADWEFSKKSIVWAGKGDRKEFDMRFFLLRTMLSDDAAAGLLALRILNETSIFNSPIGSDVWLQARLNAAKYFHVIKVALFIPRLDIPWNREYDFSTTVPYLSDDVLDLRLYWKKFAIMLANAIEHAGVRVDVIELPASEINQKAVDAANASLAIIPHRCHLDFEECSIPVMFYMQEYFRWIFVLNEKGWSAASSIYPVNYDSLPERNNQNFNRYRALLSSNKLGSKFLQNERISVKNLMSTGSIPSRRNFFGIFKVRPYIFFPLQIPHDQSIQYFSDHSEIAIVKSLVEWAKKSDVALVMKPHPANRKSMSVFEAMVDGENIFWSDAHIYDLIEHSVGVYTVNSGVGFESLLHLKPVVTFGRAEYDCVTFRASPDRLDEALNYCLVSNVAELEMKYRRFFDWFLGDYAIDISQPELTSSRLEHFASEIVSRVLKSKIGVAQ